MPNPAPQRVRSNTTHPTPPSEWDEGDNERSDAYARIEFGVRAKFRALPFTWPPAIGEHVRCINGSPRSAARAAAGISTADDALSPTVPYLYVPARAGCGNALQDCPYCVQDNAGRARRAMKRTAKGLCLAESFLKAEEKLGRRLCPEEFNYWANNYGFDHASTPEAVLAAMEMFRVHSQESHKANEARRLAAEISGAKTKYDQKVRECQQRAANAARRGAALAEAMSADPPPVTVSQDDLYTYERKSPKHGIPFLASKGYKRSKRLVGIELEFNRMQNLAGWVKRWNAAVHTDGSCGWEAVTTPIAGDRILPCIQEVTRELKRNKNTADSRCSVHVHVDATDVTWACMRRLLHVYATVEPLLYVLGGQHRAQSSYASPCGVAYREAAKCEDFKEAVLWVALAGSSSGHKGRELMRAGRISKKGGGRYRGLNIMPWIAGRRVGALDTTIEFRIHRNSLDGARIAGWASMLASLVDFAVNSSDADVDALPKSALRALCMACPDDKGWILSRIKGWRKATTTITEEELVDEAGTVIPYRSISARKGWSILCVG